MVKNKPIYSTLKPLGSYCQFYVLEESGLRFHACVFLPPTRRGPRGHPYKVHQGTSQRRRRGSAFSARVVKYWNKLPISVVTAPSVNVFKVGESLDRNLSPSPPLTEHSPPPLPTCTPPINSYHLYMLPSSLLYICHM